MRAMILAAGFGTRLRPLTEVCPKPLLPLLGQPLLGHLLHQLRQQGVREVAINLHHRARAVRQWLGDGQRWDLRLHLSHEPEILGTAGGMKQVEDFLGPAPFLVLNADVVADLDVHALWQWHCARDAMVTMVVRPHAAAPESGPVMVDAADRVRQINGRPHTKPVAPVQAMVFTGIQVVSPSLFDRIPQGRCSSTTADIYPALLAEGKAVYGYRYTGYWMDIGAPKRYLQAHWDILDGALGQQWIDRLPPGSRVVLPDLTIGDCQPSATIMPPVVLGAGVELAPGGGVGPYAVLGAGCRVEAGTRIRESVIWEDVRIAAGARICRSILGTGVRVPKASVWHNVVRTM